MCSTCWSSPDRSPRLPKRAVTPLLHEALSWHGFQLEEQPLSCQDVPAWLKRMRDRQLALPLGTGLLDPGWLEAQGLELHPDQPPLLEQLWLLLPGLFPRHRRVRSSREARHLIRTLRLRLAKVGEELLGSGELPEEEVEPADWKTSQTAPARPACQNYAPSA